MARTLIEIPIWHSGIEVGDPFSRNPTQQALDTLLDQYIVEVRRFVLPYKPDYLYLDSFCGYEQLFGIMSLAAFGSPVDCLALELVEQGADLSPVEDKETLYRHMGSLNENDFRRSHAFTLERDATIADSIIYRLAEGETALSLMGANHNIGRAVKVRDDGIAVIRPEFAWQYLCGVNCLLSRVMDRGEDTMEPWSLFKRENFYESCIELR